jgi:hypothetical protein
MRSLFHHNYQVFDVLNGSGDYSVDYNSEQLAVDQVSGSGPLYDLYLIYKDAHPNSGVKLVQIGDHLLMAEEDSPSNLCWYRYTITSILNTPTNESGYFRVMYITDTCVAFSGQSPSQLCFGETGYGGKGGTCNDTRIVVYREVGTPFLLD